MCRYKPVGLDKEGCELAEALHLGAARVAEVLNQSLGKLGFHLYLAQSASLNPRSVPSLLAVPAACFLVSCLFFPACGTADNLADMVHPARKQQYKFATQAQANPLQT